MQTSKTWKKVSSMYPPSLLTRRAYTLPLRIVETTGPRMFGLDDTEVAERRRYVGRVKRDIQVRDSFIHSYVLYINASQ